MHDYKDAIFKLVGRFNIQGIVMNQALATSLLRKNGLEPFNDKKHQEKHIRILVISEAEYNKPSHFAKLVRNSGGRLIKKKWIEDLATKSKWVDPCGNYLWKKEGDGDDEPDDEPNDEPDDEPEGNEYEVDEESEDEAYWKKSYKDESEDEESEDEAHCNKAYKGGRYEIGNSRWYNNSRRLRSQGVVHPTAPLT